VTLKQVQPNCQSTTMYGEALVRQLEEDVDFLPVVRTAVVDFGVATDRALPAVDAFLQWFSLIPISDRIEHYVMLRGDVDRVWHSMILNTVLYRDICNRYLGRFIDHQSNTGCPRVNWVLETVALLEAEFGSSLHPAFLEWRALASRQARDSQSEALANGKKQSQVRPAKRQRTVLRKPLSRAAGLSSV
jgi:hypothetical protein